MNRTVIPLQSGLSTEEVLEMLEFLPATDHLAILLGMDACYSQHSLLVGWGAMDICKAPVSWPTFNDDWWFGHINYDAHEVWSGLRSRHEPQMNMPDMLFFRPRFVLQLKDDLLSIHCEVGSEKEAKQWWSLVKTKKKEAGIPLQRIELRPVSSREDYLYAAEALKRHLHLGDIYEVNYCQYFFGDHIEFSLPLQRFIQWIKKNQAPFSAYYRIAEHHVLSASPERFLCKRGNTLIAQPIKGTAARHDDPKVDAERKQHLRNSEKERAENVMIVDLMRNDLSRLADVNSVKVPELFGLYSFPQVHQMISTVSAELRPEVRLDEIFQATFPMGSMTGAPKHRAMQLIDQYETHRRELFSGSIGYLAPNGDFDFNVVIRSLLYNERTKKAMAGVGSALTFMADTEAEYEECLLKWSTIEKIWTP